MLAFVFFLLSTGLVTQVEAQSQCVNRTLYSSTGLTTFSVPTLTELTYLIYTRPPSDGFSRVTIKSAMIKTWVATGRTISRLQIPSAFGVVSTGNYVYGNNGLAYPHLPGDIWFNIYLTDLNVPNLGGKKIITQVTDGDATRGYINSPDINMPPNSDFRLAASNLAPTTGLNNQIYPVPVMIVASITVEECP